MYVSPLQLFAPQLEREPKLEVHVSFNKNNQCFHLKGSFWRFCLDFWGNPPVRTSLVGTIFRGIFTDIKLKRWRGLCIMNRESQGPIRWWENYSLFSGTMWCFCGSREISRQGWERVWSCVHSCIRCPTGQSTKLCYRVADPSCVNVLYALGCAPWEPHPGGLTLGGGGFIRGVLMFLVQKLATCSCFFHDSFLCSWTRLNPLISGHYGSAAPRDRLDLQVPESGGQAAAAVRHQDLQGDQGNHSQR